MTSLRRVELPAGAPPEDRGLRAEPLGDLLEAVRRYRDAEVLMRVRSRAAMAVGRTDMMALRLMVRAERTGRPLTAAALARELRISTAATSVLVDRLETSGHAERRRSAADGRAVELLPTTTTHEEILGTMGAMHEEMMAVAAALTPAEASVVSRFLTGLGEVLDGMELPGDGMIAS